MRWIKSGPGFRKRWRRRVVLTVPVKRSARSRWRYFSRTQASRAIRQTCGCSLSPTTDQSSRARRYSSEHCSSTPYSSTTRQDAALSICPVDFTDFQGECWSGLGSLVRFSRTSALYSSSSSSSAVPRIFTAACHANCIGRTAVIVKIAIAVENDREGEKVHSGQRN